ncbi:hypothetical protein HK105_200669 [Polyrhizophydium stewartii]|uniref:Ankyrin repeat protein n=1 Tax=Polyrhizophydium stewartii TaxID=2732419 RepID=A0ABR4NJQ0_9FUNG
MPAEIQNKILDIAGPFTKFTAGILLPAELCSLPKQQRLQILQDAADVDWQDDLDLLPWAYISILSINIRSRSIFNRLKDSQFDRSIPMMIAARNGWTDLLDFSRPTYLAEVAARVGAIELLSDLFDMRKIAAPTVGQVEQAAAYGQLDTVRFLHDRLPGSAWQVLIGDCAAKSGNLGLVVWLSEHHPECIDDEAIDSAIDANRFPIVRWFVESGYAVRSVVAFEHAARNDNDKMFEYLYSRFPALLDQIDPSIKMNTTSLRLLEPLDARGLIDPVRLVRHTLDKGNLAALDWALNRYQLDVRENILVSAHFELHNEVLKRMFERGVPFTAMSAQRCARSCNVDLMSWILARDAGLAPLLVDATAMYGNPLLVQWWRVRYGVVFGQRELDLARGYSANSEMSRFLAESLGE